MRSIEEMLHEFPPRYASEITGLEEESWYFLMSDGTLVGGRPFANHYDILGIGQADAATCETAKRDFCSQHGVIRVCFSDETEGHLYLEIFDLVPNEAQWSAIGTLYRRNRRAVVVWDVWLVDGKRWLHGEGSLPEFKRLLEATKTDYNLPAQAVKKQDSMLPKPDGTKKKNPEPRGHGGASN